MEYFKNVLIVISINLLSAKWVPDINFQPDFDQFQFYKSNSFNDIYSSDKKLPENFEWHSLASASLHSGNTSYILYGGSKHKSEESDSGFSKEISKVILCEIKFNKTLFLDNVQCSPLETGDNNKYLGASMKAISISNKEVVIVFCDPLWHVSDTKEPKPSGKCYLLLINNTNIRTNKSIEFCMLSTKSYSTCMGGFSVDLVSNNNRVNGIEMIVGLPYMVPYGGVKLITDPFESIAISQPRNGVGKYYNFGYAVAMTNNADGYASSPLSDQYGPNVTNIREDIYLTSPDNVAFSSFGVTLTTLSINKGKHHAVVIGAPFHSVKQIQNVGKVYIFCSSNRNRSSPSDFVHGKEMDEFFGYSLANIGDINGDGNDDLAISSPYLRNDNAIGFVTLYTINGKCKLSSKPHQILKSQQPSKIGIFGIAVTGGSDMDFNSWPDVVVLSTRSNSIEMYASRQQYVAKCFFKIYNPYETQPLMKNVNITITLSVSLLDTRKNDFIDISFLKKLKLISQVNLNENLTINRFELHNNSVLLDYVTSTSISVEFIIMSLQHVKDMNLSIPINFAYRFVEDCSNRICNNLLFPLIDWTKCNTEYPVRKYICLKTPTCRADIAVVLEDEMGNEVIFGYDKSYHRSLKIKIVNNGPTEGKDLKLKITTFENLRISTIFSSEDINMKQKISSNQTKAVCKLENEIELDDVLIFNVDLYFINFTDANYMVYENNSVIVELYSDVFDSNHTNNIARIDYNFIYQPNISFTVLSKQDTVIDARNRSQPISQGQRVTIDVIGPRLSQTYIVDNIGKSVIYNMLIKISLPMHTKDKWNILYLFDKIRGVNQSRVGWMSILPHIKIGSEKYPCNLPTEYINPLDIIGFETHESHLRDIEKTPLEGLRRLIKKRSIENLENNKSTKSERNSKMMQGTMHRTPNEIIQCNRPGVNLLPPVCGDITCRIPFLPPNKQARVQINAWLWAYTFFKKQISDIMVYTTLTAEFTNIPKGVKLKTGSPTQPYSQYQQFIFKNVKQKIVHIKSTWPIVVGIVIGILILAILIVAMYKCGFFKRSKRRRHFRSKKTKRNDPVIIHPADIQTASTLSSETRFTSHSALINNKD